MSHSHAPERRSFLRLSARLAALGLSGLGFAPARRFFAADVQASAVTDYKALVCIYQFGGNDGNNLIVPLDTPRYTAYTSLRGSLALNSGKLTAAVSDAQSSPWAFHYGLAEMPAIYNSGKLAVVLNVGMLTRPLTRTQYQQGMSAPSNLFSHSDQTVQAQTAMDQQVASGWGGRLLEAFGANDNLAAISLSSPALFLDGQYFRSNVIPPGSNLGLSGMNIWPSSAATARRQALNAILGLDGGNAMREAANRAFADGLQLADTLANSGSVTPLTTTFPGSGLGNQLKEVARLIRLRAQMGPGRQVFFCSVGGYDTHTGQDYQQWANLQELSRAMDAFYKATQEAGLANQVTTFTQSEFGRTLQPNGSGTDHAWGSHQVVLGGAVKGGIYGTYPTLALGGPDDANNRGVWIPSLSTAQFGATLGKWFGASASELNLAFPTLPQFATADIGFMV
jgi:uncharacterized protein (DUF1501 family)